jgi:hypothetical protein
MRNPLRSEAEAFRFVIVAVIGALVIIGASFINVWVGVAAAVIVVGGIVWWLTAGDIRRDVPEPKLESSTPSGMHRTLLLAAPGASSVPAVDGEALVVVPALASPLEAVTGAVDDRRAEAEQTAERLAASLSNARGVVGADEPLLAVEDALRTFGADEIVIVGGDDDLVAQARERFALPVSRA